MSQSEDKGHKISPSLVLRIGLFCVYRVIIVRYVLLPYESSVFVPLASLTFFLGRYFNHICSAYSVVISWSIMGLHRLSGISVGDFVADGADVVPVWIDMLQAASVFPPSSSCGDFSYVYTSSVLALLVAFLVFGTSKVSGTLV